MKHLRVSMFVGLALVALAATGCDNKGAQQAVGTGMVQVGEVIAKLPHPVARVVGVALIAAGTALIVDAELADGATQQFKIELNDEQRKTLEAGGAVVVVDPDGKAVKVKPSSQPK